MKFLILLIVVAVSVAAGYLTEPSLRLQLTGKSVDSKNPKRDADDEITAQTVTEKESEIPFESNPVLPTPVNPPSEPEVTPPPVVSVNPETVPYEPPTTPTTPPEVVIEQPQAPATPPVSPTGTADIVLVMKASLASGQISKFSAAQVLEWEAGAATEMIDGETYQVGNVTYQAETPFGTKNLPAKALIKNGKVVRWISPKSGMQID